MYSLIFGAAIFPQLYWILRSYGARRNLIYVNHEQLYEICNPLIKKEVHVNSYELICLIDERNAIFKYNLLKHDS